MHASSSPPPAGDPSSAAAAADTAAAAAADADADTAAAAAADPDTDTGTIHEPRLWCDDGWTARVIKNEDDDGWAVEMTRDGESEPALVGPWTMGRNKKDPKPLDTNAFFTLVKTASEVLRRHEQQRHAMLHRETAVQTPEGRILVTLDIVPDDDDPYATLAAHDTDGRRLAEHRVDAGFRLTPSGAAAWVEGGYLRPRR